MKKYFFYIKDSSFGTKIVFFCFIIISSLLLSTILGVIIAYPFAGEEIINFFLSNESYNKANINILKYFQVVNQIGLFLIPPIIFASLMNNGIGEYLNINRKPKIKILIFSIFIIAFSLPFINLLAELNHKLILPNSFSAIENWMKTSEEQANALSELFIKTNTLGGLSINIFMIALLPAISEEFFFRGVLLRLFRDKIKNIHVAIFITAIIFSALHLQFYTFLPRLFLGMLLGYLFIWTGSLWVPIFAHFSNNAMAIISAFLYDNNLINFDIENLSQNK